MHDEILLEVPDDERRHDHAFRASEIMVESMAVVMRNVSVKAEPALMERWDKRAKTVLDESGRLVAWMESG